MLDMSYLRVKKQRSHFCGFQDLEGGKRAVKGLKSPGLLGLTPNLSKFGVFNRLWRHDDEYKVEIFFS